MIEYNYDIMRLGSGTMRVIISAGGTGGHIYPALAIINKIKEKDKNSEFLYIGTHNRMEKDIIPSRGIKYEAIEIYGFSKRDILNVATTSVGLDTLAAALGEEAVTIEDVYEPYLMQIGFLTRTARGRCVTKLAYDHLGIELSGNTAQQSIF